MHYVPKKNFHQRSCLSSLLIRQSAPVSVSSLSSMAPEPVGQNHLSATEEGQRDMLQLLERCISTTPSVRTKTSSLRALHAFTLLQCHGETCCSIFPRYLTLSLWPVPQCYGGVFCFPSLEYMFCLFFDFACEILLTLHLPLRSLAIFFFDRLKLIK